MDKRKMDMDYSIMALDPPNVTILRSYHHIPDQNHSRGFSFLSRAGEFKATAKYAIQRDVLPGHEIFYCLKGSAHVRQAGRRDTVRAGQMIWLNTNHNHRHWADPDDPWEAYWLRAEGLQMNDTYEILLARNQLCFNPIDPDETTQAFEHIFDLFEERRQPFDALANAAVAQLLAMCIASTRSSNQDEDKTMPEVSDILEEMRIYYQRTWRVRDIARRCGKSPAQTHRLFQRITGSSPVAWLRRIRMEQAMQKLVSTGDTVAEIAYQVGYNDPLFFSRDFKRMIGLPPSQYRIMETS